MKPTPATKGIAERGQSVSIKARTPKKTMGNPIIRNNLKEKKLVI